jgi:hypothetical protein
MSQRAFVALAVLCPLLGGCHDPGGNDSKDPKDPANWINDYEFTWKGEHVTVRGFDRAESEACAGSLAFTDAYVAKLTDTLGFDPSTQIDYQWMSPAFFADKCAPDAESCTVSGVARSQDLPQMHEIVHAVAYQNIGVCPSVLEEGLAVYFGDPRYATLGADELDNPTPLRGEIEAMLTAAPIDQAEYSRAGHFVSFLVEKYGIEAVVELCAALHFESTRQDWERASEAVLEVSVDELLAIYAKYPTCTTQQYRARLMECSGEIDHVIAPGTTTEFTVDMDCGDEHVIGPIGGDQMLVIQRIEVEQPLYALVEVTNAAGQSPVDVVASQPCKPCSGKPRLNGNTHPTVWFALDAGRHALMFYLPVDQVDSFDVKITPISGDG